MHFSHYTNIDISTVFQQLGTSASGLGDTEISRLQKQFGTNVLSGKQNHWYDVFVRQFKSPFLYLLLGASLLSFFLHEVLDGVMILLFVAINTTLGFYQEYKSEKTLHLLKQFIVTKTKILRNNHEILLDTNQLVPGDVVILKPGDIVPADIRFFETENLVVDESLLTGESAAVSKNSDKLDKASSELYEAKNIGFSGTSVISGEAKGVVINTGHLTTIGEITTLTTTTRHESSFEKGIGKLSNFILKLIVVTLIFILLISILIKGPDSNIPTLIIFAIALAISVIPEALPVVTTFSLSRGALHLAKHKVVVKRLSSIEDLGSIEVLCTDKTGTITENKLTVADVFPPKSDALLLSALAIGIQDKSESKDPFDIALLSQLSTEDKKQFGLYKRLQEIPFDPERKRNSVLVKKDRHQLIVRGAAETIIGLCTNLHPDEKKKIHAWIEEEGKQGKRVLAVAKKNITETTTKNLEKEEKDLEFAGLVSFVDPLKKSAHEAVADAEKLGVKIKILTGDSPHVAGAVAYAIGLIKDPTKVITGEQFEKLPSEEQHETVNSYFVFARVSPQQKHKIIELLKQTNEVGFLGEGINDAPALKAANIAIVVQGATDIARDAADIVLLNKSLSVIVDGIREGRAIFANTVKYIKATLASNFGNFYTVAISSLFIPFLPLLPLQILLINLLTDFPMIAVAVDSVDESELRNPRSYDIKEIALFATVMGIVSTIFDFIFFVLFYRISPQVLQTNWFIGSVLTELVFLFAIRTKLPVLKGMKPSGTLLGLSVIALGIAVVLPFTSIGHEVFQFITPTMNHLYAIFLITAGYFICTETVKLLYYRFTNSKN